MRRERLGQGPRAEIGQALGDRVDLGLGEPVAACDLAKRGPGPETHVISDHGDSLAKLLEGLGQDLVSLVPRKVDVDIGGVFATLVEEALEEQVVLDGVDVGDPQRIGDHACGRRAPSASPREPLDEVAHDQEVVSEALGAHQLQLELESSLRSSREPNSGRKPVAAAKAV